MFDSDSDAFRLTIQILVDKVPVLILDVQLFYSRDLSWNISLVLFSVVSATTATRAIVSSSKLRGTYVTVENQVITVDVVLSLVLFHCTLDLQICKNCKGHCRQWENPTVMSQKVLCFAHEW